MRPSVLVVSVPDWIGEEHLAGLRELADVTVRNVDKITEDELALMVEGFDYLMLEFDVLDGLSPAFYEYESVRSLRAMSCDVTGMDWASPAAARANGVPLLQVPDYSTRSVAETILTEALVHAHQRHLAYKDELRGEAPIAREGRNLASSTVGIVGLGAIGQSSARLFEAVGAKVLCWSRSAREGFEMISLEELFERCDVIAVCVKTVRDGDNPNVGFIGADLLERCHNAIVVNLARPELVDNDAMYDAITSGRVVAYSLDAPSGRYELEALEAVHLSPHDGWFTQESMEELRRVWVGNIVDHIGGRVSNEYSD